MLKDDVISMKFIHDFTWGGVRRRKKLGYYYKLLSRKFICIHMCTCDDSTIEDGYISGRRKERILIKDSFEQTHFSRSCTWREEKNWIKISVKINGILSFASQRNMKIKRTARVYTHVDTILDIYHLFLHCALFLALIAIASVIDSGDLI